MTEAVLQDRVRALIERNSVLTLATVDPSGHPWVSPVFYSIDDDFEIYWVSAVDARHSANVRDTGVVAIVVHDSLDDQTDAVYIEANAVELNEAAEVRRGMDVMGRRDDRQPTHWRIDDLGTVTGDGPWRIYNAIRKATWVREVGEKGGKAIVRRVPVDF